jgi:hypothetical protein
MQEKSERHSEFSERTEVLSRKIGVIISDLPRKIGVSNSMFHAYRSGNYPISAKAWRKLEAAELAAGIGVPETDSALNEAFVNYPARQPPPQNDPFSDPRFLAVQSQIAAMQSQITTAMGDFSLEDLIARMTAAGAWPPSPEDRKLRPGELLAKYPPVSQPKTSCRAPGKSA